MEYKVSKKLPFLGVSEKGVVINFETGRILSNVKPTKAGYLRVTGCRQGKRFNIFVHTLVAEEWVSGYEEGLVVNHKDGNKLNNTRENLEWVTQAENVKHAQLHDLTTSKYSIETLREVCRLLSKGMAVKDVSEKTGVVKHTVQDIKAGKWKVVSGEFSIPAPRAKPSAEAIHWICSKIVEGWKNVKIERECPFPNVSRATVSGVKNRLYFVEISKDYF